MSRDYFAILGLTPGRYDRKEVTRRFDELRKRLVAGLDDPRTHATARRELDDLHLAYGILRDPRRQAEYAQSRDEDDLTHLRRLVNASLEGGLLRHSRRESILEKGRRLGLSDFQTQLLIAQVQFGDEQINPVGGGSRALSVNARSAAARLAAVGILALAFFLAMVRWLGV